MLERRTDGEHLQYPIIHLKGEDIECVLTHGNQYGEQYYSFVNGQYTSQGVHTSIISERPLLKPSAIFTKRF